MAIHPDTANLLRESIQEYLYVATWCVEYRKSKEWGTNQAGGILGYPGAVMLFSIVDTIGSFHQGDEQLVIELDGRKTTIKKDGYHHFFVLNSDYYNKQSLGEVAIKKLYSNFRSLLVHNAALAPDHFLVPNFESSDAFPLVDGKPYVNIPAFLEVSKGAVRTFLDNLDDVVPGSHQDELIKKKR